MPGWVVVAEGVEETFSWKAEAQEMADAINAAAGDEADGEGSVNAVVVWGPAWAKRSVTV